MNPLILMAVIAGVPALLIMVARAKAGLVFMSLAVGSVLSIFVGDTSLEMVQTFMRGFNTTTQSIVQIGLLLAPMLLTLLFLRHTLSSSKMLFNLLPAVLTGVTTLFLLVPLLPPGTMYQIYGTSFWNQLAQYQAALISAGALVSLAQLWAGGHSLKVKDKGRKGKH